MHSFSVLTPMYKETVVFSISPYLPIPPQVLTPMYKETVVFSAATLAEEDSDGRSNPLVQAKT